MLYLKQFITGSSLVIFLPFFLGVQVLKKNKKFSYYTYTIVAPLALGIWNVISFIIATYLGISMRMRFLVLTFVSYSVTVFLVRYTNAYNFTEQEWLQYYIMLFVLYFITWNIIAYNVEKLM